MPLRFYQPLLTCKPYQNKSLRQCLFCVTPMKVVKDSHLYSVLHVILFFFADRLPNIFVENVKPYFEVSSPYKVPAPLIRYRLIDGNLIPSNVLRIGVITNITTHDELPSSLFLVLLLSIPFYSFQPVYQSIPP